VEVTAGLRPPLAKGSLAWFALPEAQARGSGQLIFVTTLGLDILPAGFKTETRERNGGADPCRRTIS
jgi:hypothetical protein